MAKKVERKSKFFRKNYGIASGEGYDYRKDWYKTEEERDLIYDRLYGRPTPTKPTPTETVVSSSTDPPQRTKKWLVQNASHYCDPYSQSSNSLLDNDSRGGEEVYTSAIVGSKQHLPVFDFDFSCELIPSRTPGHYHLHVNKPVEWDKYLDVMKAMVKAGLLEAGWVESAARRQEAVVRVPSVEYEYEKIKADIANGKSLL